VVKKKITGLVIKHHKECGLTIPPKIIFEESPYAAMVKYGKPTPSPQLASRTAHLALAHIEDLGINPENAMYGQHDIPWIQFYKYFENECNIQLSSERLNNLQQLSEQCGWMWWFADRVIVTHKPIACRMIEKKRTSQTQTDGKVKVLHNPGGLALEYADGTGLYCLQGVHIPHKYEWIIRETYAPEKLLSIKDVDIRAVAIASMLSGENILDVLENNVIDEAVYDVSWAHHVALGDTSIKYDTKKSQYQLVKIKINNADRIYLSMICPSKGSRHVEAVHPDCNTVRSALSWRETGIVSNEYVPPQVRT